MDTATDRHLAALLASRRPNGDSVEFRPEPTLPEKPPSASPGDTTSECCRCSSSDSPRRTPADLYVEAAVAYGDPQLLPFSSACARTVGRYDEPPARARLLEDAIESCRKAR